MSQLGAGGVGPKRQLPDPKRFTPSAVFLSGAALLHPSLPRRNPCLSPHFPVCFSNPKKQNRQGSTEPGGKNLDLRKRPSPRPHSQ